MILTIPISFYKFFTGARGGQSNVARVHSLFETPRFQCFRLGETPVSPNPFPFKSHQFVPGVGFEPTNLLRSRILSPLRKPFRHPGYIYILYITYYKQLFKLANTLEATAGIAPANSGFADRRVNYFATWPRSIN